jgi:hypothetical protein
MLVATWVFFGACVVAFVRPGVVPFEVLLWGGLILILAWWVHDVIQERKGRGRYADRTRRFVG